MNKHGYSNVLCAVIALALVILSAGAPAARANLTTPPGSAYVPGELLVKFRVGATPTLRDNHGGMATDGLRALAQQYGVRSADALFPDAAASDFGLDRIYKLTLPQDANMVAAAEAFAAESGVEYAEPNYVYTLMGESAAGNPPPAPAIAPAQLDPLRAATEAGGRAHLIVGVRAAPAPAGWTADTASEAGYRAGIAAAQAQLMAQLAPYGVTHVVRYRFIPFIAMAVDRAALEVLAASPLVMGIEQDIPVPPALAESEPMIGANKVWDAGYTGAGWTVAILDTGVDRTHPFLSGKVVSEACYSSDWGGVPDISGTIASSLCPGSRPGAPITATTAPGSGAPCALGGCDHGTHVAGIVAGRSYAGMPSPVMTGTAPSAQLIAIQVFSCAGTTAGCLSNSRKAAYASDLIRGLERVFELRHTFNIAAVNMSVGSDARITSTQECDAVSRVLQSGDGTSMWTAIEALRQAGIATVIAAGNGDGITGYTDGLSWPACTSNAISVGSVDDGSERTRPDRMSSFSNNAGFLTLLAPGSVIRSSKPGNRLVGDSGTSMAAPHVAGAWALLKQAAPLASVDQISRALVTTGVPVTDSRSGLNNQVFNWVKPRIQVNAALGVVAGGVTISDGRPFDFGVRPAGSTTSQTFTLRNTSDGFPAITLTMRPVAAPFAYAGNTCGDSLAPGAACDITVTFSPTRNVPSGAQVRISYASAEFAAPFAAMLTLHGAGGGASITPNDPLFAYQANLNNTAQTGGKPDADIDSPEAWGIVTGSLGVMVAVIDSGVYYLHDDLNDGRVRTDIDKDYVNGDNDALDDNGHGTHVAGIIAAETGNGFGTAGVAWQVRILPLKACDSSGQCSSDRVLTAIRYAADQGARVINMSLSGGPCSASMRDAINYAHFTKGAIVVAASGNSASSVAYPAAYDPVVAVGATDKNDVVASFSNQGHLLDVVAPGVNIFSTVPRNGHDVMSGTSMASPHVAAAAALLLAQRPELTNEQVIAILCQSADDLGRGGKDPQYGYGRINLFRALQTVAPASPAPSAQAYCPVCAATVAAEQSAAGPSLLSDLRAVRDQVFTQDPGRRWARIYYEHQGEVAWMLLADGAFRDDVLAGWQEFNPVFRALLNPDRQAAPVTLTAELVETAGRVMMGVADRSSPGVHDTIVAEWNRVDPQRFIGWEVRDVWDRLREENRVTPRAHLPLVTR